MDGTVLRSDTNDLSPLTVAAVAVLGDIGIRTIVATGRMFRSAARFARRLSLDGPLAAYQGALIRDVGSGTVIHHDPLPLSLAHEVLATVEDSGCSVNLYLDDDLFVEERDPFVERYEALSGLTANVVGPLGAFLDRPPTKIGLGGTAEGVAEMLRVLRAHFGERANIVATWPFFLEVAAPTATKSSALELLGGQMGFTAEDVLAFGDSYNDIDMLAWAGAGVAMADAPEEVAAAADHRCASVDEDGVVRYLMSQAWFPAHALGDYE